MIDVTVFDQVEVRVGTIVEAKINRKARHPAYCLKIDFGEELGVRNSSAQITDLYVPEALVGRQAVCCVNLTPMHIGSIKSEVRILGADTEQGVVLLQPDRTVPNGVKIF